MRRTPHVRDRPIVKTTFSRVHNAKSISTAIVLPWSPGLSFNSSPFLHKCKQEGGLLVTDLLAGPAHHVAASPWAVG
jgi:hypothetical protein